MKKEEKIWYVIKELQKRYPKPEVPLIHTNNYTLLIAVLLSAQCTDERVNTVTEKLFRIADNPKQMISLGVDEIKNIIRPCGLSNSKSTNIYQLSNDLINNFHGIVPKDITLLEKLPGVGHKTASVVMSQAFNIPSFPVDTHIHRTMYRWGFSSGKNVVQTELDAKRIFPKNLWNKLHLQIIFYSREFSPARGYSLEKDYITRKIGRKSFINSLKKSVNK